MKGLTRVLLPLVLVVGLVGGITFVSLYTRAPDPNVTSQLPQLNESGELPLRFGMTKARWDPWDEDFVAGFEPGGEAYSDFWFDNPQTAPVKLSLRFKNCTCTSAYVWVLSPDTWDTWVRQQALAAAVRGLLPGSPADLIGAAAAPALTEKAHWESLIDGAEAPTVEVPAADPARGPRVGVLRLGWRGKGVGREEPGSRLLKADIVVGLADQVPASVEFSMPLMVVPPFFVQPEGRIDAGSLSLGGSAQLECLVWSPIRSTFDVTPEESTNDPCFTFAVSDPLPESQLNATTLALAIRSPIVRGARRVTITVREQSGEARLPLGPFTRRVRLKFSGPAGQEQPEPLSLAVTGWVRGELTIGTVADKDQVDLGSFYSNVPASRTIRIKATRPDVKLTHDPAKSSVPDGVDVKLSPAAAEGGNPTWDLAVNVPANTLSGSLPSGSVIVLQIDGQPPRSVRVPLTGIATRK